MSDATADATAPLGPDGDAGQEDAVIVFAVAAERFAIPAGLVEAITPAAPLCRIPHASPALLGVGMVAGQLLPVLDGGVLGTGPVRHYGDGTGEIARIDAAGGPVGLWVDAVERRAGSRRGLATVIDPLPPITAALVPPSLGTEATRPLAPVAVLQVGPTAGSDSAAAPPVTVAVGGNHVLLPQAAIVEFVGSVPRARIPGTPEALSGVGLLRGSALPIVSLAVLLGLPEPTATGEYAVMALPGGRRALLAIDRVVGIGPETGDTPMVDPALILASEIGGLVLEFASEDDVSVEPADDRGDLAPYLICMIDGHHYGVPVAQIDRIVGPQPPVGLPATNGHGGLARVTGAIELRGQIMPVVALPRAFGARRPDSTAPPPTAAYVILRCEAGLVALAVERIERLVSLSDEAIAPAPGGAGIILGVAVGSGSGAANGGLLRILSPEGLAAGDVP